jgi:hypothetical protein
MTTIKKDELIGKYILYQDGDGKLRTEKVSKIIGNVITVKNALGEKSRIWEGKMSIHGCKIHIYGKVTPTSRVHEAVPIIWKNKKVK